MERWSLGGNRSVNMALMVKPDENDQSEDIGVNGKIMLKYDSRM
jgi:hypothetical protein